jgi:8-oxo-dGTP diphosphatase
MPGDLLTTTEAARLLGVDRSTVSRYVRLGKLPIAVRLPSGHARIRKADVERLLHDNVEVEDHEPTRQGRPVRARSKLAETAAASAPTATSAINQERKKHPVAMAIVVRDGLALMTHRRYREPAFQWNFVSGEVEPGETPEQAALREVREEVGLEVAIEHRLGDRVQPVSKRHMHYFICNVIGGDVDLVDHEENTEVAWCTLDEVYEHFEELAQIPDGMYKPLFEYLDRVLVGAGKP